MVTGGGGNVGVGVIPWKGDDNRGRDGWEGWTWQGWGWRRHGRGGGGGGMTGEGVITWVGKRAGKGEREMT